LNSPRQSFAWWCFSNRGVDADTLPSEAARIGYSGVDLLDEALWPLAARHGLRLACIAGHGTLRDGLNRPENSDRIEAELRTNIAKAAARAIPVLICFSGDRHGASDDEGLAVCADTLARVAPAAEAAGITLAIELLNSRVDHPGYQADRTSWGVHLCERVNSPAVKLLYDIYHMQIMEGDIIRTIERDHRWFAHYHTAGNPGRGDLNATQELNYPAILSAINRTGFQGYIAHEFIPATDPLAALTHAYTVTRDAFRQIR
jgi:hydroxypyruvate isomerase